MFKCIRTSIRGTFFCSCLFEYKNEVHTTQKDKYIQCTNLTGRNNKENEGGATKEATKLASIRNRKYLKADRSVHI